MTRGLQISWHVELALRSGALDNFRSLTREMVESTSREAGVLNFERFITNDEKVIHIYERYADSAAALRHLLKFRSKFGDRFTAEVERKRFVVYGNPSSELKQVLQEVLGGFSPEYLAPLDGLPS